MLYTIQPAVHCQHGVIGHNCSPDNTFDLEKIHRHIIVNYLLILSVKNC